MKALIIFSFVFITCFSIPGFATAQETKKQAKEAKIESIIKNKIESKKYTFVATYALPLHGGQHYLNTDYDLRITPDSVIAYLPYFGETYQNAPLTPEENGVMFTATKFDYKIVPMKKGGWTITILPANVKFISKMQLDVFVNGTSRLLVRSNYRDDINFQGEIQR